MVRVRIHDTRHVGTQDMDPRAHHRVGTTDRQALLHLALGLQGSIMVITTMEINDLEVNW